MGGGSAPTLTKADVANCIVQYDQQKFAVYVGKPGAQAWMCVKGLPDARRRASDMNSVQSVRSSHPVASPVARSRRTSSPR